MGFLYEIIFLTDLEDVIVNNTSLPVARSVEGLCGEGFVHRVGKSKARQFPVFGCDGTSYITKNTLTHLRRPFESHIHSTYN